MENDQPIQTHLSYGIITALIIIFLYIIFYIFNLQMQQWTTIFSYIVLFLGIIFSIRNDNQNHKGLVSFGDRFAVGFKTTAVITCLVVLFTILFLVFFPDIKEKAIDAARVNMQKKGMAGDQIQMALNMTNRFFLPFAIGGVIFVYMILGAISSLIGAALAKQSSTPTNQIN
ncbi:MAG: DUF4199 domain-containing protein [Chitinophagaceae bacterium]